MFFFSTASILSYIFFIISPSKRDILTLKYIIFEIMIQIRFYVNNYPIILLYSQLLYLYIYNKELNNKYG